MFKWLNSNFTNPFEHAESDAKQCCCVRTQETLEEGCDLIDKTWESYSDVKVKDRSLVWNSDLKETIELENLLINACITMHSVEAMKESRGAHAREDFTSCSTMGIQVTDICMDEEPGCVMVFSNDDSNQQTAINYCEANSSLNNCDESLPELFEESNDLKDYEVKECTVIDKVEDCQDVISNEEQNPLSANIESKEKMIAEAPKDIKKLECSNLASKPALPSLRTKCTIPLPFAQVTEKRASSGTRPIGPESVAGSQIHKSSNVHILHPSSTTKNVKPISTLPSRKPLQPDNKKHPDEEDSYSVASISNAASARAAKSRTIVASAPVFKCTERAEKRREFYSKLEEKHQALEAEKNQCEVRTKMPPTRAKSPKFGRRKSVSDANTSHVDNSKGSFTRGSRHSFVIYSDDINN